MTSAIFVGNVASSANAARSRAAVAKATAALCVGDQVEAEYTLRGHLLQAPDDAHALTKLAEIVIGDRRMEEATLLLRRAAWADPSASRQVALAQQLLAFVGPAVALAQFESIPPAIRLSFELRAFEAVLLGMLGRYACQLELQDALIEQRPRDPVLWINRANTLNTIGRSEEAIASLRRAITIAPNFGQAYWALANLKSWRFCESDIAAMRNALRRKLSDTDRLHFEFALGAALEHQKAFSESFEHYEAGNRIRSAVLEQGQMQVTGFVDEAIATFSKKFFERNSDAACVVNDPIFVVGLQRSGSTLIEQMLASHPLIEGAGELPVLQQIAERLVRDGARWARSPFEELSRWDPAAFDAIAQEYLERTRLFRSLDRPRFVDKLPANWLHVGLIRLALPNAKIIDARRNPMACGFSNFKQLYAVGVNYSYTLSSIGRFYRDYLRLMVHFDKVQPGAIHHVVNEELIEHPEREVRRMLNFVGVPFDLKCLDFHRNERAVNTPSAQQVRQPLNRKGVDEWRAYGPRLDPLKEALGSAIDNWLPS